MYHKYLKPQLNILSTSLFLFLFCSTTGNIENSKFSPSTNEFLLEDSLKDLSEQIINSMVEGSKKKIAIVEFSDLNGNITQFGKYISEELITRLFKTDKFNVIERQLLNKIITEQKLSLTGIIDPKSAKELGKILGVDAIVSGTIFDLGKYIKINARMIATDSGELFSVASIKIYKNQEVNNLLSEHISNKDVLNTNSGQNKEFILESNEFRFHLTECKILGNTITCNLLITNLIEDREFMLYSGYVTRLFDDFGNEYYPDNITLGNKYCSGGYFSPGEPHRVSSMLISNVPIKSTIKFNNVNNNIKVISLLEIACTFWVNGEPKYFNLKFKNIPLSN